AAERALVLGAEVVAIGGVAGIARLPVELHAPLQVAPYSVGSDVGGGERAAAGQVAPVARFLQQGGRARRILRHPRHAPVEQRETQATPRVARRAGLLVERRGESHVGSSAAAAALGQQAQVDATGGGAFVAGLAEERRRFLGVTRRAHAVTNEPSLGVAAAGFALPAALRVKRESAGGVPRRPFPPLVGEGQLVAGAAEAAVAALRVEGHRSLRIAGDPVAGGEQ